MSISMRPSAMHLDSILVEVLSQFMNIVTGTSTRIADGVDPVCTPVRIVGGAVRMSTLATKLGI
jgi:hypothetical protein